VAALEERAEALEQHAEAQQGVVAMLRAQRREDAHEAKEAKEARGRAEGALQGAL